MYLHEEQTEAELQGQADILRVQLELTRSCPSHGLPRVDHRIRIYTEEKENVVAAVWGTELLSIPCCASYFAR